MARSDDVFATIEAIHAAGLDGQLWPQALSLIARVTGSVGSTLEVFERPALRHLSYLAVGIPPAQQLEYLDEYAKLNLRLPLHAAARLDEVIWDYRVLDEQAMRKNAFYAFLDRCDLRYFVSGIVHRTKDEFAAVTVQRSPKQGHADRSGLLLMERIVPHVRQAFEVSRRLKAAEHHTDSLESAFDMLGEGIVMVRADGTVVFANAALEAIARRGDGVAIRNGAIELEDLGARSRLAEAIAAILRLPTESAAAPIADNVAIARRGDQPPYVAMVRPLVRQGREPPFGAVAIVFVHDPLARNGGATNVLRDLFGFTEAEAALAQALQSGTTVTDYARSRRLSLNTVYTHLRRLREKTGSSRLPELIHKLNELRLPLRGE